MAHDTSGKQLRRTRGHAGMTQAELAETAGVPLASLRNWEQERNEPTVSMAAALARALGVSLDALAGLQPLPCDEVSEDIERLLEQARNALGGTGTDAPPGRTDRRVPAASLPADVLVLRVVDARMGGAAPLAATVRPG